MFYSTKEKLEKVCSSYSSVPSSPSMTDATTKKKMFARKPANAVGNLVPEKKKTTFEESLDALTLVRTPPDTLRPPLKPTELADWRQRERGSEVGRDAPVKTESSISKYRQIFFSPKSQKSLLLGSGGVLQRKPSKNHTEFKPKDMRDISLRSTIGYGKEKSLTFEASMDSEDFRKNLKFKTNSSQSFISPVKLIDSRVESRRSSEKSLQEGSLVLDCSYCLNHKKKADILAEKYAKLEEQYNIKVQAIKDLTGKCDFMAREKAELCQKLERAIEGMQLKEEEFFRVREELTMRIESYKKDAMRLTENIKYNQIEKSMLLRFKNDFHMLSKECDQLKYENDLYKKQLIAQANKEHGYSFNKRYQGSPEPSPGQFSKKQQAQNNIYYDCEDDSVSLNFSEHSCDYP